MKNYLKEFIQKCITYAMSYVVILLVLLLFNVFVLLLSVGLIAAAIVYGVTFTPLGGTMMAVVLAGCSSIVSFFSALKLGGFVRRCIKPPLSLLIKTMLGLIFIVSATTVGIISGLLIWVLYYEGMLLVEYVIQFLAALLVLLLGLLILALIFAIPGGIVYGLFLLTEKFWSKKTFAGYFFGVISGIATVLAALPLIVLILLYLFGSLGCSSMYGYSC